MGTACSSEESAQQPQSAQAENMDNVDNVDNVDVVAGNDADIADGEMFEVQVDGNACLLVKSGSKYHALSGKCTHYGASLAKGSFDPNLGVVRCPWHGACFNVESGDIEDFPGLDSLHRHEASVDGEGKVHVSVSRSYLAACESKTRRQKPACERDLDNGRVIAVIGGGGAAQAVVETLRQECNYSGRLVIFSDETDAPYDRPKLSKAMTSSAKELALRPEPFYAKAGIEFMPNSKVVNVDSATKTIHFEEGTKNMFRYDQLVIASGSSPRKLNVPNADKLSNIFTLRTPGDANAISDKAAEKDVVVVGSSFIGMEVAAVLVSKAKSVTVVGSSELPFQRSLGPVIGRFFKDLHESKGVDFEMGTSVKSFEGVDSSVSSVVLQNGKTLPAAVVVLGIGVTPNTDFLKNSGINRNERGFIPVKASMETSTPGVFAVGDVAAFPLACMGGQEVSIGHWQLAHAHGRVAALNLAGKGEHMHMQSVPFFWTQQFGKSLRYAGYATNTNDIIIDGSASEGSFVAYFCQDGLVTAVATLMRDPLAADFANLLRSGRKLKKEEVNKNWKN